ncbi:YciI family protein [Ferrovibrio terrae]|uniref:YciI family protein n=1 Tax=Ferrovibrio terrae TaxID=2594003 RepID=A0A516H0Y0_9PROT|nr:YciI family protein [Ferrovibrio terrae]QDO97424.1 YciI family protein [Ferrovibrio terrae]
MLYAILCYNDEAAVEAWPKAKDDAVIAKRRTVTDKLAAKGQLGPILRLMNTTAATTVRYGAEPVVIDGPFAETKEQLLGLYVIDVASLDEAVDIARGMAGKNGDGGSGAFEIRPLRAFIPDTEKRETMIS